MLEIDDVMQTSSTGWVVLLSNGYDLRERDQPMGWDLKVYIL